jgi:hypothetical protein
VKICLTAYLTFFFVPTSFGQLFISNTIPFVNIMFTTPFASSTSNPGVSAVCRCGNPTPALNAHFRISGTASDGIDYAALGFCCRFSVVKKR